jgi:hypothetical protein
MMTDDLTIPKFLRRDPAKQQQRVAAPVDELGRRVIPMPAYDPAADTWLKPKGMSLEEWNASKQVAKEKSIAKLKAIVPKAKRYGAMPADFKTRPYRWDTRRGKWVPDGEAPTKLASGLILTSKASAPKPARPEKSDNLRIELMRYGQMAQLKAFAVANGCWDDKYGKLPNVGLVRMNVINRLRAKIRKGYEVKWPK